MFRNLNYVQVVASVPDLITILDSQSGSHLGTPECKPTLISFYCVSLNSLDSYGLRVTGGIPF